MHGPRSLSLLFSQLGICRHTSSRRNRRNGSHPRHLPTEPEDSSELCSVLVTSFFWNSFHSVRIHVHFCSHHGGKCVSSSWREFLPGFIFPLIGHRIDPLFATSKPTIFGHPANRIFPPTLHRFVVVRIVFPPSCRFFLSRNGADFGREETAPRCRQTESPLEDVSTVFPPCGELAGTVFGASFFPPIRSRSFIGPSFPSRRNSHYPRRNRGGDGSLDSRQQLAHCAICAM